jgi:osmotically-inducible protein OsmY
MKSNEDLQKEVQDAIKWEPKLHAAEIGVVVHDGIVTLTGTVDNYAKKIQAENAAKHIKGVKAVVEKIEVKFNTDWAKHDDNDIAKEIVHAYKWNWQLPDDKIHVKVENGWITLDGETNWNYQREEAKNAAREPTVAVASPAATVQAIEPAKVATVAAEALASASPATGLSSAEQRKLDAQKRQQLAAQTRPLKRELEQNEQRMAQIETEKAQLEARLSSPLPAAEIADAGRRLKTLADEVATLEERWLELTHLLEVTA